MRVALSLSMIAGLVLAACASKSPAPPAPGAAAKSTESIFGRTRSAVATLSPAASGPAVSGLVSFSASGSQVDVHVVASGFVPGSVHGFHIHENGNCASPDFMSAGGHFNPEHHQHGPQNGEHHAGDMPSLLADPTGKVDTSFTLNGVSLGGAEGFVGHAVIIHAGPDDYTTQPTGNSGARIACGVIAAN